MIAALFLIPIASPVALADLAGQETGLASGGQPWEANLDGQGMLWVTHLSPAEIWRMNTQGGGTTVYPTDDEVIAAAKLARAHDYIERLPEGYNTLLGERGSGVSLGQRQLLAIARAALADPRILILDEATSSVDTRTERQIQAALETLLAGRTSFVIAHRLSTIRNADQLLVIQDGEIVERGRHEELLAQRGAYYELYMRQFRGQELLQAAGGSQRTSAAVASAPSGV